MDTMTPEELELETLRRARAGDAEAGRAALRMCYEALTYGTMTKPLAAYLAERLWMIDQALEAAESMRGIKKSGSIRSARDAGIAEALCINKAAGRPADPRQQWQMIYAAFGVLLLKTGMKPEAVKGAMFEARQRLEGTKASLDRSVSGKILKEYLPMHEFDDETLLHYAGPLRDLLPTFRPQTKGT